VSVSEAVGVWVLYLPEFENSINLWYFYEPLCMRNEDTVAVSEAAHYWVLYRPYSTNLKWLWDFNVPLSHSLSKAEGKEEGGREVTCE